jgi:hypothetical protein
MVEVKAKRPMTSAQVALYVSGSVADAWEEALLPWFKSVAKTALTSRQPVVVVTPSPGYAAFLRERLLAQNISLLGVKFLSPFRLRELLLRGSGVAMAPLENRRLFLSVAAEVIATETSDADTILIAKSVARDPDQFLRAFEQLDGAGWNFDQIDPPALRKLAHRLTEINKACGFASPQETNTAIPAGASSSTVFSQLLIAGFDGAHWPLWPLLHTATSRSSGTVVILNNPRAEAREIDEIWIGTWEESFGPAQPIGTSDCGPAQNLRGLAEALESGSPRNKAPQPNEHAYFLVGANSTEQAKAIVALAAGFLGQDDCDRLGILFPRRGSLSRLVAHYLEAARIPHTDSIAHLGPSAFDTSQWRAWLELQENPGLKTLLGFARASDLEQPVFGKLPVFKAEKILRCAYAEVLLNDVEVLREYCVSHIRNDDDAAVTRALERLEFLPGIARFADFLASTRKILSALGWRQHWNEIERLARTWSDGLMTPLSKRIYLRWLRECLGRPSIARDDQGNHPYSRAHLLTYAEAESQTWSHLIFAGLNEELWPAIDDESTFVHDQEIDELNERNKILNRRAVRQGRQGEGQLAVDQDRSLLLGSRERRAISLRRLLNLVETASTTIGASANLYSEAFPSRIANPNEFFSRLYFAARRAGVSQETMRLLQAETAAWLGNWSPIDAQKVDSISVGRARYAYDARRQIRPAGEYEFALRHPPEQTLSLRVTEWEKAMRWPALTWMKIMLGVEAEDESGDAWAIATGQWVHDWLAQSVPDANGQEFVPLREVEAIRERLVESARRFLAETRNLCKKCARPLPDWWISGWSNALYIADCLAAKLSGLSDWTHLATERLLDSPTVIPLGANGEELRLRGRIDLILARGKRMESPIRYSDLWVVDYKTGRQRGFNLRELRKSESPEEKFRKQLVDGRGVQLGLYALAVHALGAQEVRLTLLSPVGELESQFSLQHVFAQRKFWLELCRMQESGVFGMLGPVHTEFGIVRAYPLATLGIDPDLLQEKWELTHPSFAVVENRKPDQ